MVHSIYQHKYGAQYLPTYVGYRVCTNVSMVLSMYQHKYGTQYVPTYVSVSQPQNKSCSIY